MSQPLAVDATIPAHPLGRPLDGRPRYGMTPEQAVLYRWLVENKPHRGTFDINSRAIAPLFLVRSHSRLHDRVVALIERGWLQHGRARGTYELVEPVMHFAGSRG